MSNRTQSSAGTPVRAAIYVRISRDRAGAGLGVERQEADCRALADRLGWEVVEVFEDNDISAYSGKPRPAYQRMLEDVEAGRLNGIVAWHTDRLHRRAVELESFITVLERHAVEVQTVSAGTVDLSSASGRMVARMLGAAAQHEVDHARERISRAKAQAAIDGKYRGGPRPFGYEKDGMTIRESEAAVIREMTTSILAGRTLASLAKELNDRGITSTNGRAWNYMRLKEVLVRPRNAGLLHRGRPGRNTEKMEIVGPAQWPGPVEEDQWRALYEVLTDPSRRISGQGNATRWLGSGIYVCGRCGGIMRQAPYRQNSADRRRRPLYRCTESAHLAINVEDTDAYIRSTVADLIRDPRVIAAMSNDDETVSADRARRTVLSSRLESFERDYMDGVIDGAMYQRASAKVEAEISEVEARLNDSLRRSVSRDVVGAVDPGTAFLEAPIDVQRAILASTVRVTIHPVAYRGARWSSDRVEITSVAD